jgi:hypothetical protein
VRYPTDSEGGKAVRTQYFGSAIRLFVIVLFITGWSTAWACPSPTRPASDSEYATIVLAEVIGVRLTDYADARLRQLRERSAYAWASDASAGYEVEVIPLEVFKGSAPDRLTLQVPSGCGIPGADLSLFGIFYVDPRGHALPIYQDDLAYRERLVNLGSRYTTPCTTGMERLAPHPCWKPRRERLECLTQVKDITYSYRSSCPAGVQEFRERLHSVTLGRYDWQMPPRDPNLLR